MAVKHPYALANTLLVSMSDETVRGRFASQAKNAVSIGTAVTLKAHHALKWILNNGAPYLYGTQLAIWETSGFKLPNIGECDPYEDEADIGEFLRHSVSLGSRGYFNKLLSEYKDYHKENPGAVVVLAIDSATGKGRSSIVYYQEIDGHEYLDNLLHWYEGFCWASVEKKDKGEKQVHVSSPLPKDICNLIYSKSTDEGAKKLKKQLMKELIPCITNKKQLPNSLERTSFHKAVSPLSFSEKDGSWDKSSWEKAVFVACAIHRKINFDKGVKTNMLLDKQEQDRSYLYGRLLAFADEIEERRMYQTGNPRTTNAMRYMQRMAQRPAETWCILRTQKLEPYLQGLKEKQGWYRFQLTEIESLFIKGEMEDNSALSIRFIEGFSNQKAKLRIYDKDTTKLEEEEK